MQHRPLSGAIRPRNPSGLAGFRQPAEEDEISWETYRNNSKLGQAAEGEPFVNIAKTAID